MGIDPTQLRHLIKISLIDFHYALGTQNAVELLMLIAAHESHCGTWLWQNIGDGTIKENTAYGIFQMERPAYLDACVMALRYKPNHNFPEHKRIISDLRLAIITARCYMLRFIEPFPSAHDVSALAQYWKTYWNTVKGKGKIEDAIENYRIYGGVA